MGTNWQRRFFFVELPGEYPLKRYWRNVIKGVSKEPDMIDLKYDFIQRIHKVPDRSDKCGGSSSSSKGSSFR